jgi:UDP-N-acetylglucosamine acyltransferase
MSSHIHQTAIVHPNAKLGHNVTVGPFSIIEEEVEIGDDTWIGPHVVIKSNTKIGKGNRIFQFASVGEDPQDLKYQGGKTYLEIGDYNKIRESCTINRGTEAGGGITRIGNHNLLMAYTHVAHDCILADHIVIATHVSLAGHVRVDKYAVLGGFAGVHQFCHVGAYSFAAAGSLIVKDVLPFIKVSGYYAKPFGLNTVGLQRHNFSEKTLSCLKTAYKTVYRQDLTTEEALQELIKLESMCEEVKLMVEMLRTSERGIVR